MNRAGSLAIADSTVKSLQELNQLRDQIRLEREEKEKKLQEAIAPLKLQMEELERALASSENRRREMWLPFKGERNRLMERDQELSERESSLDAKEEDMKKKEKRLLRVIETYDKTIKQARRFRDDLRKKIKSLDEREQKVKESEKWASASGNAISEKQKDLEKRLYEFEKRQKNFEMNCDGKLKLIHDRQEEVRHEAQKVAENREKLRVGIKQWKEMKKKYDSNK